MMQVYQRGAELIIPPKIKILAGSNQPLRVINNRANLGFYTRPNRKSEMTTVRFINSTCRFQL